MELEKLPITPNNSNNNNNNINNNNENKYVNTSSEIVHLSSSNSNVVDVMGVETASTNKTVTFRRGRFGFRGGYMKAVRTSSTSDAEVSTIESTSQQCESESEAVDNSGDTSSSATKPLIVAGSRYLPDTINISNCREPLKGILVIAPMVAAKLCFDITKIVLAALL